MQSAPHSFRLALALATALLLSACGNDTPTQPPPAIYALSGSISGLAGGTVTLVNTVNGDSVDVTGDGSFGFNTRVADATAYNITVASNPLNQTCTITRGNGTVDEAHITDIAVRCVVAQFTLGGSVSGLGGNLLLQNNGGNDLAITANGNFTFANTIAAGTTYRVTVRNQPAGQTCTVSNGNSTASGTDVTGVTVQCINNTMPHTIGGNISGLDGTLVIQNNGGNNLTVNSSGAFVFSSPLNMGTAYSVSILTQPLGQNCTISNPGGTANNDVTDIDIQCIVGTYTVGGTITGLNSIASMNGRLSLRNNGEVINRSVGGTFSFPTPVTHDSTYNITVNTQPYGQDCLITNGAGTVAGTDTFSASVICTPKEYTLGFSVTGLTGTLILANAGTSNSVDTNSAPGTQFNFTRKVTHGSTYNLVVGTQPDNQHCAISNGRGTAIDNVSNIAVSCSFSVNVAATAPQTLTVTWAARPGATHYRLLKNPDGLSGETQVGGDINGAVTSAIDVIAVHRHDWLNARYIVEACIGSDCIRSVPVDTTSAMIDAIGYFKSSNPFLDDDFGHSLAISADGSTMVVGAPREDIPGLAGTAATVFANAGGAHVFTRSGSTWTHQAHISAANAGPGDLFGTSATISTDGNTVAIAAPGESSAAVGVNGDGTNNSEPGAGAVYVFVRNGSTWSQQAYIKPMDPKQNDVFGASPFGSSTGVSLSADGTTLAIGASGHETENTTATTADDPESEGAVYVFVRNGTTWSQQALLKASNVDSNDVLGFSVSISADGNTLAAGAPIESGFARVINGIGSNNLRVGSGAVYVFTRSGTTWSQQAYVKTANADEGDRFGAAVSISADGNTMAAGAMFEDSTTGTLPNGNESPDSGAVYIFKRAGDTWTQDAMLKADVAVSTAQMGYSVAISADGNTLVAGAGGDDSNSVGINGDAADTNAGMSGAAFVFRQDAGSWQQQSYVKASNTGAVDLFGTSVSLTADGSTLVVSAPHESSSSSGINGVQANNSAPGAGAVYLY